MKKTILLLTAIFMTYIGIGRFIEKADMIPSDAIRMRIVPNSNTEYDQRIKRSPLNFLYPLHRHSPLPCIWM